MKKAGATAGTKNEPLVLRTLMAQAARAMKSRNGNMIAVICPVRASLPGILSKPWAMSPADGAGQEDAEDDDQADDEEQDVEDVGGEAVLGLRPFALLLGQDGDEGRDEGVLGEQVAQQVGDAEGGPEGVVGQAGAEEMVDDDLADQAQNPAEERFPG